MPLGQALSSSKIDEEEVLYMTKIPHTEGPWTCETKTSPTRIVSPKGDTVAAVYGGFAGGREQLANARLIASATTLLKYVEKRAAEGDQEAKDLVAALEQRDAETA